MKTNKTIIKKAILLLCCVGLLFTTFSLVSCTRTEWETDYEFSENSFSLEVVGNRTDVRVGDTVTVIATFRNLSGRNLRIWVAEWDFRLIRNGRAKFDRQIISMDDRDTILQMYSFVNLNLRRNAVITSRKIITIDDWYRYGFFPTTYFIITENRPRSARGHNPVRLSAKWDFNIIE